MRLGIFGVCLGVLGCSDYELAGTASCADSAAGDGAIAESAPGTTDGSGVPGDSDTGESSGQAGADTVELYVRVVDLPDRFDVELGWVTTMEVELTAVGSDIDLQVLPFFTDTDDNAEHGWNICYEHAPNTTGLERSNFWDLSTDTNDGTIDPIPFDIHHYVSEGATADTKCNPATGEIAYTAIRPNSLDPYVVPDGVTVRLLVDTMTAGASSELDDCVQLTLDLDAIGWYTADGTYRLGGVLEEGSGLVGPLTCL